MPSSVTLVQLPRQLSSLRHIHLACFQAAKLGLLRSHKPPPNPLAFSPRFSAATPLLPSIRQSLISSCVIGDSSRVGVGPEHSSAFVCFWVVIPKTLLARCSCSLHSIVNSLALHLCPLSKSRPWLALPLRHQSQASFAWWQYSRLVHGLCLISRCHSVTISMSASTLPPFW